MNSQVYIHALRVQLLAMSRLSQRALDYSVKGYELRNLDFARQVGTANEELEQHYRRIRELCREAVNGGIPNISDFRFAFAALSVAASLRVTYSTAAEIAQGTIRLLETSGIEKRLPLEKLGQTVNASMRLCIIALFERNAGHALAVLRNEKEAIQLFELRASDSRSHRIAGPQQSFERMVMEGLAEVAKQVHEMASSLLFWLEGNRMSPVISITDVRYLAREVARAPQEKDTALYIQSKQGLGAKPSQTFSC